MRDRGPAGTSSARTRSRPVVGRLLRRVGIATTAAATALVFAIPAVAQDGPAWPMFDADAQATGQSQTPGPNDPGLKWHLDLEEVETTDAPEGYNLRDGERLLVASDGTVITRAQNEEPQYDRARFGTEIIGIDPDDGEVAWQIEGISPNVSTRACRPALDSQDRVWAETRPDGDYALSAYDATTGDQVAGTTNEADDQRCREHLLIGGADEHLVFADGSPEGLRILDISGAAPTDVLNGLDIDDADGLSNHGSHPGWGVFTDDSFITAVDIDDGDNGRIDLVEISLADGSILARDEAPAPSGVDTGDFDSVILLIDEDTDTLVVSLRSGPGSNPGPIIAGLDLAADLDPNWTFTDMSAEPRDLTLGDGVVLFQEGARTTAPGATLKGVSVQSGTLEVEGLGAGTRPLTNPDGSGYTSWRTPDMTRDRLITGFSTQGEVQWTIPPGRIAGQLGLDSEGDLNMGAFASLEMASIGPDGTLYVTGGGDGILALDNSGGLAQAEAPFPDVDPDSVHAPNIQELANRGITTGDADGNFNPSGNVTRAQFATFLVRALDIDEVSDGPFTDVDPSNVHAPNINAAAEAGITTGVTETTFDPNGHIIRAQVASLLARAFELDEVDDGPFTDVDPASVHAPNINAVAEAGITTGVTDTTFNPDGTVTRAQMASLLIRALDSAE